MMSQTHILLAAGLFAKPEKRLRNTAVLVGALVPDVAIYLLFLWSKINAIPEKQVWDEIYWQEPWQTYTAAGNSIPIYLLLLFLGVIALRTSASMFRIGLVLTFFALGALVHVTTDLPVHVADAHRHFWPLSDWKFISPVSYWHPDHHGRTFMVFEGVLGATLCALLFVRFKGAVTRCIIGLLFAAYIAVPAYFFYALGGA